ncbi:MAG: ABC transporter permease [Planctomycetota bacterium]
MGFIEIIQMVLRDLALRKFRSSLATLGIIFGVASVLAMISISEGAKQVEVARYSALGVKNIILSTVKPLDTDKKLSEQNTIARYGLLRKDLEHIQKTFAKVSYLVGLRNLRKNLYHPSSTKKLDLTVLATESLYIKVISGKVSKGRFLTELDNKDSKRVCIVGTKASRQLFKFYDPLQQGLRIDSDFYSCVGLLDYIPSKAGEKFDPNNCVFIPMSTAELLYGDQSIVYEVGKEESVEVQLDYIILQMENEKEVTPTARRLENYFKKTHKQQDYEIFVPIELLRQKESTQKTWALVMGMIAGISLLVGGIGIMNIMLANVSDRRKEIGTRRALGARRKDILRQFVLEAATLTGLGGFVGVVVGYIIGAGISHYAGWPVFIPRWAVALSVSVSCFTGLFFGYWPAHQAAKVLPIEALRTQ